MKYWVYMNGEVPGSYTPAELAGLKGFTMTTLVCPAEGEILEKNWRRSGEFPDIITVLHERDARLPPSAPPPEPSPTSGDVNALIDTASARLFGHVSALMKELETRREEKALTLTLQRQLLDLKDQLQQTRDRATSLEGRMPRLQELEDAVRKDQAQIQGLETALKAREEGMSELRVQIEKLKTDLENARRRMGETLNDLSIRNRLVDKLSRDLTEKEMNLAKALGVIRRLEDDLNRIAPAITALTAAADEAATDKASSPGFGATAPILGATPAAAQVPVVPVTLAQIPVLEPAAPAPADPLTPDVPPPPQEPHPDQPAAQGALVDMFKKFMTKYDH